MKKMLCPQCKIAAMYVKNEAGERRLVYVTSEGEVVPKKEDESLEGLGYFILIRKRIEIRKYTYLCLYFMLFKE